jgi:hypothetical protein
MGIKSAENWSGIVVNGVTLGVPVVREDGTFEWDGGVPEGTITDDLTFQPAGDAPAVDMGQLAGLKIDPWRQPSGAHDAYTDGSIVKLDDGTYWKSTTPANVHAPGVSGWRQLGAKPDEVFPWKQPAGGHDAYKRGAKVTYGGFTWENTGHDANVWAPGVFGWTKI